MEVYILLKHERLPLKGLCLVLYTMIALTGWLLLWRTSLQAVETKPHRDLYQFLDNDLGFSAEEFYEMKNGKIVTKKLIPSCRQEVAVFSIVRVNASREFFVRDYMQAANTIETAIAETWGTFNNPPELDDVKHLSLPSRDLEELVKCEPRDCKFKAPADAINRFRLLDRAAPDFEIQANTLIRQATLHYVREYLKNGSSGLVEYCDKENPVRLADEFRDLLDGSAYLYKYAPELQSYLEDFPNRRLLNTKDIFFWMKEDLGGKADRPIISINHTVFYQKPVDTRDLVVASKQLYATHYFEASLGLTATAADPENGGPGFYLMHINRSRIDIMRQIPRFLAQELIEGARDLLDRKMLMVKRQVEKAWSSQ
jgi:hypothetical protein